MRIDIHIYIILVKKETMKLKKNKEGHIAKFYIFFIFLSYGPPHKNLVTKQPVVPVQ